LRKRLHKDNRVYKAFAAGYLRDMQKIAQGRALPLSGFAA
jgi:hypothetical protein